MRVNLSNCLFVMLFMMQTSYAADKALLDVLLANKVIGQSQYDALLASDKVENSVSLLAILKQNGAISDDQYQVLIKQNSPADKIIDKETVVNEQIVAQTKSNDIIHAHGGMNAGGASEPNRIGKEVLPGVNATFGGFIEAAGVYRSKNETQDINSSSNVFIPFDNSTNAHQTEFRQSARQSRLSLLLEGNYDTETKLASYVEMDFLGVTSANSIQASAYSPRLRLGYASIDWLDSGWHVLAGQSWSLLTTNKIGINPRSENPPLMIDGGFVPGFNYTRGTQFRVVKDFADRKLWFGLSLENPQVNMVGLAIPTTVYGSAANVSVNNSGSGSLSPSINYSTDLAPDIIAKMAVDPGWGHYELFGLTRFFHSTINNSTNTHLSNHVVESLAAGLAAIVPVAPKLLDVQLNLMAGNGFGRYSSAQIPDVAFSTSGAMVPLTQYTGLVGIIAHPDPKWDVFTYFGGEIVNRYNQSITSSNALPQYGYGDASLITAGCNNIGGICNAQTANVWQITPGFWTTLYGGNAGTIKTGLQYSYTRRNAFSGVGNSAPHTDENMFLFSLRYYPLQK